MSSLIDVTFVGAIALGIGAWIWYLLGVIRRNDNREAIGPDGVAKSAKACRDDKDP